MELTAQNVEKIFLKCLAGDTSNKNYVEIEGIVNTFGMDGFWIDESKDDIKSMLSQLDDTFMTTKGGGWSFINMPMRADGVQWGQQFNAEQLMVLGLATGDVKMLMPREMWSMFHGGMPYIAVVG